MRPTMCINALRPRPRPFKFGWVSISLCYSKFLVFCPASLPHFPSSNLISSCSCRLCTVWWKRSLKPPQKAENVSELQLTSISDQYLLYVFMYSWVYNGVPQPCFSSCMVDYTLMTDQMTTIFCFQFYMGSCTRRLNFLPVFMQGRTSSDFNENQPKHQNRNRLFATICDEICILPSSNLILDIPITKLTELWL